MHRSPETEQLGVNYLIVISAPSGAGKTTLCKRLLNEFDHLKLSISSTTRKPRGTEKNGVEYYFLEPEEFEAQIRAGHFVEWAKVHGNYYGTSRRMIEAAFKDGKSVLLDIDVQGAEQLRKAFQGQCFTIFITPPSLQELEARLRARGTESEESIQRRLRNAKVEMAESAKFDHIIVNDSLERAYVELKDLLARKLGKN